MYYCEVGDELLPAPEPTKEHVLNGLKSFTRKLMESSSPVTALTLEEVVETYSGRKRTIYEQAKKDLDHKPVSREDAYSAAFVKVEKGNTAKAPRCIQPRKPRYNLSLGRYIKPLEHKLYRWIARVFGDGPTVMKGYNVDQVARIARGKWNSFKRPVGVGLDAKRFDMHVNSALLGWEHQLYLKVFKNCPELRRLLRWQMYNRGGGYCDDGKLFYKVKGKRFSGDMNTACGNCLIMCGLVWTYALERGIHVKLINNGDDCFVFMEAEDLAGFMEGLSEWFYAYGLRMTVEQPVYDFQLMEFCQMRPVRVNGVWTMVRNIMTALAKDTMCIMPGESETGIRKWLYSVGQCGLALCRGVPIMESFYNAYVRNGVDDKGKMSQAVFMQTGMRMLSRGMDSRGRCIDNQSRYDVYVAWGITPDEQVALERYYDSWQYVHTPTDIISEPIIYECL